MSRSEWTSRAELGRIHEYHAKELVKFRDYILKLAAVVDRVNTHGYHDRLLQDVYANTGVTAEKVADLQAKKAAKAAAYRAREERGA